MRITSVSSEKAAYRPDPDASRDRARNRVLCLASDDRRPELDALLSVLAKPRYEPTWIALRDAEPPALKHVDWAQVDAVIVMDDAPLSHLQSLVRAVSSRVPIVCIGPAAGPTQQADKRQEARERGASDYLGHGELSPALLEAALHHTIERAEMMTTLEEVQQRFALAVQGANDGWWEWNLATDDTFFSHRWKQLLGYENGPFGQTIREWFERVHPADFSRLRADVDAHLEGRKPIHECEHRVRASDGNYRWVLSRGLLQRDGNGGPRRMAGSLTDISDFRRREQALRHQSRHDSLTALPRREPFMERVARAVELSTQYEDYGFAVLLVEVDRLRMVNESIGHSAGDEVLSQLARRLAECVGEETLIARFAGAKFSILLEDVDDPGMGTKVADQIHSALGEPFEIDGQPVYVTVSIGMTSSAREYHRPEEVISDVIAAATRAKDRLLDRHEMFSTHMRVEALTLMRLEMALRQAVEREEFQLYYQPIVSLQTGYLVGFEALIRWNHPRRGLVSPAEFIPVAENTGIIVPMGKWAIRAAIRQLQQWHRQFEVQQELSLSVNLSAKQVEDSQLFETMAASFQETGADPRMFKVELTESVVMENAEAATALLDALRRIGVQIWIDDFGTGYSSLSYLHRFPVDGLKIDKSFTDVLDGGSDSDAMVRTIINLAQNLGVEVVAEGIEQKLQADQLRELGCQSGQGFLFGRPMPADEASALIAQGDHSE